MAASATWRRRQCLVAIVAIVAIVIVVVRDAVSVAVAVDAVVILRGSSRIVPLKRQLVIYLVS